MQAQNPLSTGAHPLCSVGPNARRTWMPKSVKQTWKVCCLIAVGGLVGACTTAQQQPGENEADSAFKRRLEIMVQKCVRERTMGSARQCRSVAYAAALANGFSRQEAARLTGYNG